MHGYVLKAELWIQRNDCSVYFCKITIPAFHAGDLKGVATTGLHLQI